MQYQWQFNGVNMTGRDQCDADADQRGGDQQGNYDVIVYTDSARSPARWQLLRSSLRPESPLPCRLATGTTWINYRPTLSVGGD